MPLDSEERWQAYNKVILTSQDKSIWVIYNNKKGLRLKYTLTWIGKHPEIMLVPGKRMSCCTRRSHNSSVRMTSLLQGGSATGHDRHRATTAAAHGYAQDGCKESAAHEDVILHDNGQGNLLQFNVMLIAVGDLSACIAANVNRNYYWMWIIYLRGDGCRYCLL